MKLLHLEPTLQPLIEGMLLTLRAENARNI